MSKCNGHIQGEPGHEQVFFCPEYLYVELQAENERLKDFIQKNHPKHRHDHDYYHINCTLCSLEKIAYKEVSRVLKGDT